MRRAGYFGGWLLSSIGALLFTAAAMDARERGEQDTLTGHLVYAGTVCSIAGVLYFGFMWLRSGE